MRRAFRRQLPARSPVSLAAIWSGCSGIVWEPAGLRDELAAILCRTYGAREALLVGSGTEALQLALAGIRRHAVGRPIALPAYGCYAIATAADGAGIDTVLYDLDPVTLGPEAGSLERALDRGPAGLVAAHLYGLPVDVRDLERRCAGAGIVLVEDAAQGAGGSIHGRLLGSFGSLTVLSFGRGKATTAGAGGALLARDEAGTEILSWARTRLGPPSRGWREAVALAGQWAAGRPAWYWLPASLPFLHLGETRYHPPGPERAMSVAALRTLATILGGTDGETERRRALAERLLRTARNSPRVHRVEPLDGAVPGYLRLPLRLRDVTVADAIAHLGCYGAAPAYPAVLSSLRPFGGRAQNNSDDFSGARELAESLVTFPTHDLVEDRDVHALEDWLSAPST